MIEKLVCLGTKWRWVLKSFMSKKEIPDLRHTSELMNFVPDEESSDKRERAWLLSDLYNGPCEWRQ